MKKLLLALCLTFMSMGVFAATETTTTAATQTLVQTTTTNVTATQQMGCYPATSSCGVTWEICGDAPIEMHMLMWDLIDRACGTSIWYIEISA